jgi:hypothetical protein
MNKGIIRSSENIDEIADIVLSKWDVRYNSKTYIDVELIFNTTLDNIFDDYNYINSVVGYDGLKVYIREASNILASEIQLSKNGNTYSTSNIDGDVANTYTVSPAKNSLRFNYNPLTYFSEIAYTVIIRIHEGIVDFEREFTFNITNPYYADDNGKKTFTISPITIPTPISSTLNITSSVPVKLHGYSIKSDDVIKFTIQNQSNGITSSGSPTSVNNSSGSPIYTTTPHYGYVYDSTANIPFSITPLAEQSSFAINPSKKIKIHLNKTSESFDINYTNLICHSDILIDSVLLGDYASTSSQYTIYIPVMDDVNDVMTVVFKDGSNVSNKLSSTSGSFNVIVTTSPINMVNGTFTFNVDFDPVPLLDADGTAWGSIEIKNSSNDIILTQNLIFTIQHNNVPPNMTSFTVSPPVYNSTYFSGDQVTFTATAVDIDGTISEIKLYKDNIYTGDSDTTDPYQIVHTLPSAGVYSYTGRATDDLLNEGSNSSPIVITIVNNVAPSTASMTDPSSPGNWGANGQSLVFSATAIDGDDGIDYVEFFVDTISIGNGTYLSGNTYTKNWTGVTGSHDVYITVYDNHGLSLTSSTVNFTITP